LQTQRLRFGYNSPERLLKQYGIDGSMDLEIFTNVVCRGGWIDLLSKPNAKLGS
jgi:hypothetical protein